MQARLPFQGMHTRHSQGRWGCMFYLTVHVPTPCLEPTRFALCGPSMCGEQPVGWFACPEFPLPRPPPPPHPHPFNATALVPLSTTLLLQAPIDDKTKTLLLAAVALLGVVGTVAGGKALVSSLQSRISTAQENVQKLVIVGAFWLVVFIAARAVLEL